MPPKPERSFKTSIWRPAWIGGSVYLGAITFVAGLKDVFDWFNAAVVVMHAHPILVVGGGVISIVGNVLYTDNRYYEQQRELEAVRNRKRPRRSKR